ncbi:hypothetical protein A2685_00765 [Candidatus Woesebacteria bacterium RIFCSPHIGHO2_01_FULL_37_10]|uniref:Uncharacterized protein n=1 Tax=Candidatus Woesebacteria bacterium RIFCSPHIGHO2_01_FULL_37_10 TaxID=1802489 RepID=A0A1F7XUQ9_9BACT|nr:MAG: hypothetical protein A2685_00765 [Candidatus Woesebacteria bacterium RIFCSPHIGHO2_01_FULL_37_10]
MPKIEKGVSIPKTFAERRASCEENYMKGFMHFLVAEEALRGKITPVEEVAKLNLQLDRLYSHITRVRKFAKEEYGLDLPDPIGEPKNNRQL